MREQLVMTDLRTIEAPSNCPSCDSSLEWKNDILYCLNPDCYAKNSKRVEHWAKTLKIKGLGPATIEKLSLQSIEEIYQMELFFIEESLGSAKIACKVYKEIMDSTESSLEELLPAFGIPLIGETASKKLCKVISTIEDINYDTCVKAGLGPVATDNLLKWWMIFRESYLNLPLDYTVKKYVKAATKDVVCISGKLLSYKNKTEAKDALEKLGYEVKDTLTKDVTILVNESGIESAKTKKARDTGVKIVKNLKEIMYE